MLRAGREGAVERAALAHLPQHDQVSCRYLFAQRAFIGSVNCLGDLAGGVVARLDLADLAQQELLAERDAFREQNRAVRLPQRTSMLGYHECFPAGETAKDR